MRCLDHNIFFLSYSALLFVSHQNWSGTTDLTDSRWDFLDRGSALTQGRYLHITTQTQRKADRHPCLEWDSKSRSHCLSGRRYFMPYTARPPCSLILIHKDPKIGRSLFSRKQYLKKQTSPYIRANVANILCETGTEFPMRFCYTYGNGEIKASELCNLQWLRSALSRGPNRVGVSPPLT
jgi:hypothetical protein